MKVCTTKRFDIFRTTVERDESVGLPRDVYMAWHHSEDVPRSVCEVTLWGNYVEWLHVCEHHRRKGIATEVLQAITDLVGPLNVEGVTESGEAFEAAWTT